MDAGIPFLSLINQLFCLSKRFYAPSNYYLKKELMAGLLTPLIFFGAFPFIIYRTVTRISKKIYFHLQGKNESYSGGSAPDSHRIPY